MEEKKQAKNPAPKKKSKPAQKKQQVQTNDVEIKKTDTLIYALGGLGEVGKNMYCIEQDDEILIIDSGVLFPDDELLGVDYVIPDYTHLVKSNKKLTLVITHGHEDHIGGIPFLLKTINIKEIYAPRFAISLINKKLEERKMLRSVKLIQIDASSKVETKHFSVGFYNTTHSIPDSLGVLINTSNGRIVHTGDFKFDLTPVGTNTDYQVLAYLGQIGIDLLLSDSTNSGVPDFSISEQVVANEILGIMKQHTETRLIVATFASNVHRVAQIIAAAEECGRKVCVFGRSMENVVEIARKMGVIEASKDTFITPDQLNHMPASKVCIVCTGSQGEPLAALSRIANGTHRHIKLMPGDTVVFSSNAIPGNQESVNQVVNKLFRAGANVLTKSVLNNLHTTGHASQEEQKLMLQLVKPRYFMPIHGEYKMLKQHKDTAVMTGMNPDDVFTCGNGDVMILRDHTVFPSGIKFQADNIYIDGNDISGLSTAVLKDRTILGENGLVSVIIPINSKDNKVLSKPIIVSRGFVFLKDSQELIKEAESLVYNALNAKMKERTTFGELKNTVRMTLEPFLYKKTHRNPIVIPVIINSKEAMASMAAQKRKPANKNSKKPKQATNNNKTKAKEA